MHVNGKKMALYSLGSALLLALAMPGLAGWWQLSFVALVPLLFVVLHTTPVRSGLLGFAGGLAYNLIQFYWILIVLGNYAQKPWWIAGPSLVLLAGYMACYQAIFCVMLCLIAGRYRCPDKPVTFLLWAAPVLWVGLDALREIICTGYHWLDLGYYLSFQPQLIQGADLGGHHLLTFSIVLCNGLLVATMDFWNKSLRSKLRRWDIGALLGAIAFLSAVVVYSLIRHQTIAQTIEQASSARVAIIQGNIDQKIKWAPEMKQFSVDTHLRLSLQAVQNHILDLLVWPEVALPYLPLQESTTENIYKFSAKYNTWILTGALGYSPDSSMKGIQYHNEAVLIEPQKETIVANYQKRRLLPFGEYIPLRHYLSFLSPVAINLGQSEYTPGEDSTPFMIKAMRIGTIICSEAMFPILARDSVANGANLLVNLANDAWFGQSSGPVQALAITLMRAAETKRSIIRSANTGISVFADPLGRISRQSDLDKEEILVGQPPMLDINTVFTQGGCFFGAACCAMSVFLAIAVLCKHIMSFIFKQTTKPLKNMSHAAFFRHSRLVFTGTISGGNP
jgi:apolipoprotein N-acyltransferase